jgi:HTH-type transcriptional regulator/antitoxin MqsA
MAQLQNTEVEMFKCHVCGSAEFRNDMVNEVFEIEGQHILVENIPATICARCGDETFSRATTEKIRRMARGEAAPAKSVPLNVFAYPSAA